LLVVALGCANFGFSALGVIETCNLSRLMPTDRLIIKYCGEHMYLYKHKLKFLSFLVCILALFSLNGCKAEEAKNEGPLKSSLLFMVVDLDGDGFEFIPLEESSVYFDVDGDGLAERTEWVHPDDGFLLIRSASERREITSPFEMIINRQTNLTAKLKSFDKNQDKRYDFSDFVDTGRQKIKELMVTVFQDENTLAVQQSSSSSDYTSCKDVSVDFSRSEIIKLSCAGLEYRVQEKAFQFEDTNIKWDVVCQGAQTGASYDADSKRDYLKYCINK
jgi:hypothetical protein